MARHSFVYGAAKLESHKGELGALLGAGVDGRRLQLRFSLLLFAIYF